MNHSADGFPCMACRQDFHANCFGEDCECPCSEPDPFELREAWEATRPLPDYETES